MSQLPEGLSYPLKEFDILTRIGTHEIDNEGMVQAQDNLRLSFMSQVPKLVRNGTVPVSVVRDGKTIQVRHSPTFGAGG